MLQRDAFIEEVKKRLETDKDIYFLSADFGAAALDSLREQYPDNLSLIEFSFKQSSVLPRMIRLFTSIKIVMFFS